MPVIPFGNDRPKLREDTFLAPDAWVTGNVTIGARCTLLFGVVARGDINPIRIGNGTNLQEHVLLHTSHGLGDCTVGDNVTVGHHAIIHGCTINSNCIIGMNATILDGAEIGEWSIVGAHALVTMNKKFPPRSLILGNPAKVVREISDAEIAQIKDSVLHYQQVGQEYLKYFLSAP